MKKERFDFGKFVEKYRFWVGGGLLFLILIGAGFQLYRENYGKESDKDRITKLELRITELENKITKIQLDNNQSQNNQTEPQGQVAGTSAQNTDNSKQITAGLKITGKININTATKEQLISLPGIGETKATAIIEYRNSRGVFKSIDELDNVSGIGPATINKFRDQVTI
jgi:comEA protein